MHPVDDVRAKPIPGIGCEAQSVAVERAAERGCPRLFGAEVAAAELVAGVVVEVGECGHPYSALGVDIHRTVGQILVSYIGATREMMSERGVVVASETQRGAKLAVMKRLLREVCHAEPVGTFHQMQDIQILEIKAVDVRYLAVGTDGVAEIGGMDVVVGEREPERGSAEP